MARSTTTSLSNCRKMSPHNSTLGRFAWTLYPRIKNYLGAGVLRLVRDQSKDANSGVHQEEDKMLGRRDIKKIPQAGEVRSTSPEK